MGFPFAVPPAFYGVLFFFSAFIENLFPPYPGDLAIAFGGYLAAAGDFNLNVLIALVLSGNILGASLMYFAGERVVHFFRHHLKIPGVSHFLSEKNLQKTNLWFRRYGWFAISLSRLVAGVRFFASVIAGALRMPFLVFLVAYFAGSLVWNAILLYAGYLAYFHGEKILENMRVYNYVVIGVVVALGVFLWVRHGKRESWKGAQEEDQPGRK